MSELVRLRIGREYLVQLGKLKSRKKALLKIKQKYGTSRRSVDRYVAEVRARF